MYVTALLIPPHCIDSLQDQFNLYPMRLPGNVNSLNSLNVQSEPPPGAAGSPRLAYCVTCVTGTHAPI